MAEKYRATCVMRRWVVETQLPAINGLTAWVQIADCGFPQIEDEMFPSLDRERNAEAIAAALNDQARADEVEAMLKHALKNRDWWKEEAEQLKQTIRESLECTRSTNEAMDKAINPNGEKRDFIPAARALHKELAEVKAERDRLREALGLTLESIIRAETLLTRAGICALDRGQDDIQNAIIEAQVELKAADALDARAALEAGR